MGPKSKVFLLLAAAAGGFLVVDELIVFPKRSPVDPRPQAPPPIKPSLPTPRKVSATVSKPPAYPQTVAFVASLEKDAPPKDIRVANCPVRKGELSH